MKKPSSNPQQPRPTDKSKPEKPEQAPGTEAEKKGGAEPAKRQAQRDWEDSPKESGD